MLQFAPPMSDIQAGFLPQLPSDDVADKLLESVYHYTQSRYCLVDWVKVRGWHRCRHSICYVSDKDEKDAQIGKELVIQLQIPSWLSFA